MNSLGRLVKTVFQTNVYGNLKGISSLLPNIKSTFRPCNPCSSLTLLPKSNFSSLCFQSLKPNFLAAPPTPLTTQVAGFKVRYVLKRRCKDCYFVVRQQRKYVICPTHPRHKQKALIKKQKYVWKITHATQSKVRAW